MLYRAAKELADDKAAVAGERAALRETEAAVQQRAAELDEAHTSALAAEVRIPHNSQQAQRPRPAVLVCNDSRAVSSCESWFRRIQAGIQPSLPCVKDGPEAGMVKQQ